MPKQADKLHRKHGGPLQKKRVACDFPVWTVQSIRRRAMEIGVAPQDLINYWVGERIKTEDPQGWQDALKL